MELFKCAEYRISLGEEITGKPLSQEWTPVKVGDDTVLIIDNDGKTLATIKIFSD